MSRLQPGLVQVYTGNGKGKTTAAMGLAMRALGRGLRVVVIQFVKAQPTGEQHPMGGHEQLEFVQTGAGFVDVGPHPEASREESHAAGRSGWQLARRKVLSGEYDLVVLDEINYALLLNLIPLEEVLDLIAAKPRHVELVLTGREAPARLLEVADLVTEMRGLKHPWERGIPARIGIEF